MVRVILAFGRERHEYRRFRTQGETAVKARVDLTVRQTMFSLGRQLDHRRRDGARARHRWSPRPPGRSLAGDLLVILSYVTSIYAPLEQISNTVSMLQQQFVGLRGAMRVLDMEPEVKEAPRARRVDRTRGSVAFEAVNFAYAGRENALEDVTFRTNPGDRVAIVGPDRRRQEHARQPDSTASTTRGRPGRPRRHGRAGADASRRCGSRSASSCRSRCSSPARSPTTSAYGRLDASMGEIVEAARAANAHDFIKRLPDGYDTELGERGAQLSGGERQRIAVARAFLKDAPILILDEPTSSIDSRTEAVILDALDRLMIGRTTFMIAHRLSTVREVDRILVARSRPDRRAGNARTNSLPCERPLPPASPGSTRRGRSASLREPHGMKPKIVVLGMMSRMPVAGVVWQTVQYLVGLERLGFAAYYVEAHAVTPSMFTVAAGDHGSRPAAAFIDRPCAGSGWLDAGRSTHSTTTAHCYGMTEKELSGLYRSAALIVNLHGGTVPLPEHATTGRLVYVETDPVRLQVELAQGCAKRSSSSSRTSRFSRSPRTRGPGLRAACLGPLRVPPDTPARRPRLLEQARTGPASCLYHRRELASVVARRQLRAARSSRGASTRSS